MFKDRNEDDIKRKIVEKISTKGVPETVPREISAEERKKWFKNMPKERKTPRALQYFTHSKNLSSGDILSWGYLEDLKVYAIRREEGVQYFEFLYDIGSLPWWDVDELIVRILENGEKDITLDVKLPKCLKNMPLRAIEQDFHDIFQGWFYNETKAEEVISLFDKSTGESRRISILDPMWLVNCSKKDIYCLFLNKIVYEKRDKNQAMQYQSIVDVCFAQDINSGRYWKSKWRDIEIDEFLKSC
ncbi:hypothetical protein Hanom_Chr10g00912591 [Helianthus anomalus]